MNSSLKKVKNFFYDTSKRLVSQKHSRQGYNNPIQLEHEVFMALDFMASNNQKKIDGNTPVFSLEKSDYDKLFNNAKPLNQYPIIKKFDDYYADTTILYGEIQPLIKELESLIKTKKLQLESIIHFIDFLEKSFNNGLNVYIFCD
ncbi:hypothetical protein A9G29_01580 [Gilliamella sp. Fer2-1]|jgi:hypothetical protein|uniref:hypothetical protein n=1 Tax=Gilliamella sp. WF3-4 TaxID=3120255 RepID=UPI00080E69A3|nr:hypothetical protein [Gilliamella apicola]OCG19341.1 hypothetical protein A9G47_03585 [Gilliamella apicola]OCG35919.1 hypothetical protein A9G29_01580 [Gilliamella apicola]